MVFDNEKREYKKVKLKPAIQKLGAKLAEAMFASETVFLDTKASINDVIERLIVIEASKYDLLPEEEFKTLLEIVKPNAPESISTVVMDSAPIKEQPADSPPAERDTAAPVVTDTSPSLLELGNMNPDQ